jgi:hypothetical protein
MKKRYYDGEQEPGDGNDTAPVSSDDRTSTDAEKERDA